MYASAYLADSDLEVEGGGARAPMPHSWRRHW